MNLISLLSSSNVGYYNKEIARMFGLNEAIILSELCSKYEYWKKENKLTENEFFFETQETIEENTTLSSYQQRNALKTLEENKILTTKLVGIPAKKYFKINENELLQYLTPRCEETAQLEVKKLNSSNIKYNNTKDNIISNNKLLDNETVLNNDNDLVTKYNNILFGGNLEDNNNLENREIKRKKDKDKKKLPLPQQCMLENEQRYSNSPELLQILNDYLYVRLKIKDKPLEGLGRWKGLLNKLDLLSENKVAIVQQSIDNNWATFVELKPKYSNSISRMPSEQGVNTYTLTEEQQKVEDEFIRQKQEKGEKIVF